MLFCGFLVWVLVVGIQRCLLCLLSMVACFLCWCFDWLCWFGYLFVCYLDVCFVLFGYCLGWVCWVYINGWVAALLRLG